MLTVLKQTHFDEEPANGGATSSGGRLWIMSRDRRGNIRNVRYLDTGSSLLRWPNRKLPHAFAGVSIRIWPRLSRPLRAWLP
jgi:hypothetical protein